MSRARRKRSTCSTDAVHAPRFSSISGPPRRRPNWCVRWHAEDMRLQVAGTTRASPRELGPERFREHAIRCREELEEVVGRRVLGFRLAGDRLTPGELWMLDVLAECGYLYDSSIGPALGTNAAKVLRRYQRHKAQLSHRLFHEVPISSMAVFGLEVPIADGGSLRHFPPAWMRNAVEHWHRHRSEPYVMYFRTWELDPGQPRINAGPRAARIWHYRNLDQMPALLEQFLAPYRFTTIAAAPGSRGCQPTFSRRSPASCNRNLAASEDRIPGLAERQSSTASAEPMPVTVVIPCFNESQSLALSEQHAPELSDNTFVMNTRSLSSSSTTGAPMTPGQCCRSCSARARTAGWCGTSRTTVSARSIQTGIRHAETQVVCSIDCDCTYDPHELGRMIPLLTEDVDLVTASPYHPAAG